MTSFLIKGHIVTSSLGEADKESIHTTLKIENYDAAPQKNVTT